MEAINTTPSSRQYVCPQCRLKTHHIRCPKDKSYTVTLTAFQAAQGDKVLGTEIGGRYGIIERLGMGGMGAVYKAIDPKKDLTVAIKVLREAYAKHPAIRERFIREAEAGASLEHPNVVPLIDFGVEKSGRLWLAMEYVKGWTLRDEINHNGAFSVKSAIELTKQVLRGLSIAHDSGMIHRDLKHDNIMYYGRRNKFTARIVDFGVVKSEAADILRGGLNHSLANGQKISLEQMIEEASSSLSSRHSSETNEMLGEQVLTAAGMMVGSPSYMSPEQIRGLKVGPPADLYALAVVIYEILTARRLFTVNDYETLLKAGAKRDAPRLVFTAKNEFIPEVFANIIHRALAHDPTERYPDAHTMLLALEQMKLKESTLPANLLSKLPERVIQTLNQQPSIGEKETQTHQLEETQDISQEQIIKITSLSQSHKATQALQKKTSPPDLKREEQKLNTQKDALPSSQKKIYFHSLWLLPPLIFLVSTLCAYLLKV